MKAMTLCLILGMGAMTAGCASPNRIRQGAYDHMAKARKFEAEGQLDRAAKERAAAEKQFRKAEARSRNEAGVGIYRY